MAPDVAADESCVSGAQFSVSKACASSLEPQFAPAVAAVASASSTVDQRARGGQPLVRAALGKARPRAAPNQGGTQAAETLPSDEARPGGLVGPSVPDSLDSGSSAPAAPSWRRQHPGQSSTSIFRDWADSSPDTMLLPRIRQLDFTDCDGCSEATDDAVVVLTSGDEQEPSGAVWTYPGLRPAAVEPEKKAPASLPAPVPGDVRAAASRRRGFVKQRSAQELRVASDLLAKPGSRDDFGASFPSAASRASVKSLNGSARSSSPSLQRAPRVGADSERRRRDRHDVQQNQSQQATKSETKAPKASAPPPSSASFKERRHHWRAVSEERRQEFQRRPRQEEPKEGSRKGREPQSMSLRSQTTAPRYAQERRGLPRSVARAASTDEQGRHQSNQGHSTRTASPAHRGPLSSTAATHSQQSLATSKSQRHVASSSKDTPATRNWKDELQREEAKKVLELLEDEEGFWLLVRAAEIASEARANAKAEGRLKSEEQLDGTATATNAPAPESGSN